MSRVRLIAIALVAVAAIGLGVALGLGGGRDDVGRGTDAVGGATTTSPTNGSSAASDPQSTATPRSTSRPNKSTGAENLPEPSESPSESASAGESSTSGLPGLRGTSKSPALTDLPTHAAHARGRLVASYPSTLLPTAPRARVVTSSVSPDGDRVQVALVARPAQRVGALLRFYRVALARRGFVERPVAAAGSSTAVAFERDGSSVVVTMLPGETPSYSVFATLVAKA